jgi:hypothetical protein
MCSDGSRQPLSLSPVPLTFPVAPRAARERSLAPAQLSPHASENGNSRSLDSPRGSLARPCLRGRRSRLETSSVVYPSHALLVRGACYVLARPGVRSQPPHPLHSHVRSRSRQRARELPSELARPDPARSRRSMTSERAQARRTDVCSPHSFVVKDEQRSCVSCHYRFHYSELSPVSLPDGVPRFTASTPRFGGSSVHAVEHCPLAPHPEHRTSDAPSLPRPPRPLQVLPPAPSAVLDGLSPLQTTRARFHRTSV